MHSNQSSILTYLIADYVYFTSFCIMIGSTSMGPTSQFKWRRVVVTGMKADLQELTDRWIGWILHSKMKWVEVGTTAY